MTTLRGGFAPQFEVPPELNGSLLPGRRVVLVAVDEAVTRHRYLYGYRVASEVFTDDAGIQTVHVLPESSWDERATNPDHGGEPASLRQWPAGLVWVEK